MQIGIPAETVVGENRVAATPETVKKLISAGHSVVIERRAGVKAAYIDSAYEQVGATLTDDAYTGSQMILKVRAPQGAEIQKLAPNTSVIAMFDPYRNTELDQFASQHVSAFALELLPRTLSRAQNMDVFIFTSQLVRLQVSASCCGRVPAHVPNVDDGCGYCKTCTCRDHGGGCCRSTSDCDSKTFRCCG